MEFKVNKWITGSLIRELKSICPGGVHLNVKLSKISSWKIGGIASCIVTPDSDYQLANTINTFNSRGIPYIVMGATSNLLFDDAGLLVPCIQIGRRMSKVTISGTQVTAQAGIWIPGLARKIMQASLTGAEHFCGIPGTLGGLICMNGGSQQRGIGDSVIDVVSISAQGNKVYHNFLECGFSYRKSIFLDNNHIITSATLNFEYSKKNVIRNEMLSILRARSNKFPRKEPNCGSVFKSNPMMYDSVGPPGLIIEKLGFKGKSIGDAIVSNSHANFIVNRGHAKSRDILKLITIIQNRVYSESGYMLEVEPRYVTRHGRIQAIN